MSILNKLKDELYKEASAIQKVAEAIDEAQVEQAIQILSNCQGKVVVTGVGKTGIIAKKISATLASTGTTSIFLHAAEGIHGDLGMLSKEDVVIAVSNSGNNPEILSIIPFIKFLGIPLISICGNKESQLAKASDVLLEVFVDKDLEALGLVPTASTTCALAVGDAIAIILLQAKNFSLSDYARFHPGGTIGKRLLLKVKDLMHSGNDMPMVTDSTKMSLAILEMTTKKLGCTIVNNIHGKMIGIITDGDLRRFLQSKDGNILDDFACQGMTKNPKHAHPEDLAVSALILMETHSITMLPVLDDDGNAVGILHMHDLIKAGVV